MGFTCRICDRELEEMPNLARCTYCGLEEPGDYACPAGHYVCEACRTATAGELIERTCLGSDLDNPLDLAGLILKHPAMLPYGPEHHSLAAPVLLAALRNRRVPGITDATLRQALARLQGIPALVCATRGDCGAAASAGVVVSLLRKASAHSDGERSDALRATARALDRIADHGGPRCCRQSVYDTILATWDLLRQPYGLDPLQPPVCRGQLKDCKTSRCIYFG